MATGQTAAQARVSGSPAVRPAVWSWGLIWIGLCGLVSVVVSQWRAFDPFEWLTLHSAWNIAQGYMPYAAYFERQAPFFPWVLSALCWAWAPEQSYPAAAGLLVTARLWMVAWYGLALAVTWALAASWRGRRVAWVATALLAIDATFADGVLAVRAEAPLVVVWLGSMLATYRASQGLGRRRIWALAGLCLGGAMVTSWQALLLGPVLLVGLAWAWRRGASTQTPRARLAGLGLLVVGACLPGVAVVAWLAANGALGAAAAFLVAVPHHLLALPYRLEAAALLVARHLLVIALALAAVAGTRRPLAAARDGMVGIWTAGSVVAVFLVPATSPQQYAVLLPLLSLWAAETLVTVLSRTAPLNDGQRTGMQLAGAVWLALVLYFGLDPLPYVGLANLPASWHVAAQLWGVTAVTAVAWLAWRRPGHLAAGVVVLTLGSLPLVAAGVGPGQSGQLAGLQRVMAVSRPTDTVMDGMTGFGTFRPQALRRANLLPGEERAYTGEGLRRLIASFEGLSLTPRVIVLDRPIHQLSDYLVAFLRRWYRPIDPVDRQVLVRRQAPLPYLEVAGSRPGQVQATVDRQLAILWSQPGTKDAFVVVPDQLMGPGIPNTPPGLPGEPPFVASFRHAADGWSMGVWIHGGYQATSTSGTVAWRQGDSWQVRHGTGRQSNVGHWWFDVPLTTDESLPPWLLVRPDGWRDWFVVGIPVRITWGRPVPTATQGPWQVWPRAAGHGVPGALQVPAGLPAGTRVQVTGWVPLDTRPFPLDLPGAPASTLADAVSPFRPHRSGLAGDLNGAVLTIGATAGMVLEPAPGWSPEAYRLRAPGT